MKGLAQGPNSCADLIMAAPGIEPPTLRVQVKLLNHSVGCYGPLFPSPGIPELLRAGPVCDPLRSTGDVQPAALPAGVTRVCCGGCGGAELPGQVGAARP